MVAFTKTRVGNKLFVVEWLLSANNEEVQGDAFEAEDAKLISISSYNTKTSGTDPNVKLYCSNHSDLEANPGISPAISLVNTGNYNILSPLPGSDVTTLFPPPTRWLMPRLESNSGVNETKIALLFEEIK